MKKKYVVKDRNAMTDQLQASGGCLVKGKVTAELCALCASVFPGQDPRPCLYSLAETPPEHASTCILIPFEPWWFSFEYPDFNYYDSDEDW